MSATIRNATAFVVVGMIVLLAAVFVGTARADGPTHTQKPPTIGLRHHGRLRCVGVKFGVTSCGVAATVTV